jgi:glucosamine 6-phosphate synthetase-like amidotransferase/phosphosugar isomerase protein
MGLCNVEAINEDVGVVKQTAKISILNQISKGQKYVIIEIQIGLWRVRWERITHGNSRKHNPGPYRLLRWVST